MTPITVILPTFERAQYIREAIDSALAQTFTDFVLSIGDNSRDDSTEKVVAEYDDPRIRYRRHPRNLGQQGNWLHLIDTAETPLVASLHDDDAWHPDFLEKLVPPMLADPSVSMAFADFWVIDEHGDRLEEMTAEYERAHPSVGAAGGEVAAEPRRRPPARRRVERAAARPVRRDPPAGGTRHVLPGSDLAGLRLVALVPDRPSWRRRSTSTPSG